LISDFGFDSFLRSPNTGDASGFNGMQSVDFNALDQVQDGVTHWADRVHGSGCPPGNSSSLSRDASQETSPDSALLDSDGFNETGDSDVEMANGEPVETQDQDCDMLDDSDKVCYGMVRGLSELPPGRY
jgi:hypothetical protein